METEQLVDLGRQMNLAGEELTEFVRAEQALARDEKIRIREEKKEDEERTRQHKKEDEERMLQKQRGLGNIRRKMNSGLLQKQRGLGNIRRKMKRGLCNMRREYYVYK